MKIMYFNTLYHPNQLGGAEKSVQLLAESMLERGNEVILVSTHMEDRIDDVNGVKSYYLNHRNLYWGGIIKTRKSSLAKIGWHAIDIYNPVMKKKIDGIIEGEKPDVIHTNNLAGFSIAPWISAKQKSIPVIHTLRDYSLMCPKATMFEKKQNCGQICSSCKLFTNYKKKLSNEGYINIVTGNSQFIIDRHKNNGYFNQVKGTRVFNGAETRSPVTSPPMVARPKYLYYGRIETNKGTDLLLEVFTEYDKADLYIGGKITNPKMLARIQTDYYPKNIKFLGFINPHEYLPEVDAVLVPSLWHEPLARTVLESYSYGKPVIGSDRGGNIESIVDGKTGFIFNPDSKEELIKILESINLNPQILTDMKSSIDSYFEQFDIKKTVVQYEELYKSLIPKKVKTY